MGKLAVGGREGRWTVYAVCPSRRATLLGSGGGGGSGVANLYWYWYWCVYWLVTIRAPRAVVTVLSIFVIASVTGG